MELTKSRIYYSPISFGIKTQMFWPFIDMIAMYYGLLMLLIFLFLLPSASAVGNYFVPIMVRYKDMAYPTIFNGSRKATLE